VQGRISNKDEDGRDQGMLEKQCTKNEREGFAFFGKQNGKKRARGGGFLGDEAGGRARRVKKRGQPFWAKASSEKNLSTKGGGSIRTATGEDGRDRVQAQKSEGGPKKGRRASVVGTQQ